MRWGIIAVAGAALLAAAAVWTWAPTTSTTSSTTSAKAAPQSVRVAAPSAPLPAAARNGRLFLSQAQLDQALATGTLNRPTRSLLKIESPMHFGDFAWNETGIPAGQTWIRVDLGAQIISIFRAGHEIGTAVIVYGGDNKKTPLGKLHVLGKARDHRSSLYDAAMPYTLRLTDDGVSIHGSKVRWGAATHGCIGVPLAFARRLFEATSVGDEVVVVPPDQAVGRRKS